MVIRRGFGVKYEDIGPYKSPKSHQKSEKKRKYSKKANEKIHRVIREFEEGNLHSGSKKGPQVRNLKQAVAIGISEARRRGYKSGKPLEKNERKKKCNMDKAIKKVKKDIDKKMDKLVKMDIPRDKAMKTVKRHLKGDIKDFKKEEAEDRSLLKKIKGSAHGRAKSHTRSKKKRA